MDMEWCAERLQKHLELINEVIDYSEIEPWGNHPSEDEITKQRPTIKSIIEHLDPDATKGLLINPHDIDWQVRNKILAALGVLEDYETVQSNLAPDTPTMEAGRLHRWVWEPVKQLWQIEHYRAALASAASSLNEHLQAKVNRSNLSETQLVRECFSDKPPEQGKPRLRFPGDPSNQTVQSYQNGIRDLATGCFMAIRNPASHSVSNNLDELTEQEAFEQLAALSLAARLLEKCLVITAGSSEE